MRIDASMKPSVKETCRVELGSILSCSHRAKRVSWYGSRRGCWSRCSKLWTRWHTGRAIPRRAVPLCFSPSRSSPAGLAPIMLFVEG